jgi:hypothetical protein
MHRCRFEKAFRHHELQETALRAEKRKMFLAPTLQVTHVPSMLEYALQNQHSRLASEAWKVSLWKKRSHRNWAERIDFAGTGGVVFGMSSRLMADHVESDN